MKSNKAILLEIYYISLTTVFFDDFILFFKIEISEIHCVAVALASTHFRLSIPLSILHFNAIFKKRRSVESVNKLLKRIST